MTATADTHALWHHFDKYPALNRPRSADGALRRLIIAAIEDALGAREESVEDVNDIRWNGWNFLAEEDSVSYTVTVDTTAPRSGRGDFRLVYDRDCGRVLKDHVRHYTGPLAAAA